MNLELLTKEELISINGGEPNKDTSLAYDVFWTIGWIGREIVDGIEWIGNNCGQQMGMAKC